MASLHEILAVETDKEGYFKKAVPELIDLFKNKVQRFQAHSRTLKLLGEETLDKTESEKAESENVCITTTVPAELNYLSKLVADYLDIIAQKDNANCNTKADVIIDDEILLKDIPATTLLSLENKLKYIRQIYEEIPTLQPGVAWEKDLSIGKYVYKDVNPEVRAKTKKTFDFKVLVPATDKHPAQIEKWDINVDVGYYTKFRWSGMLSVADKSLLLGRLDKLIQAIKQARQRANEFKIAQIKLGDIIFKYIHKDICDV
jgi:hypothetical protein